MDNGQRLLVCAGGRGASLAIASVTKLPADGPKVYIFLFTPRQVGPGTEVLSLNQVNYSWCVNVLQGNIGPFTLLAYYNGEVRAYTPPSYTPSGKLYFGMSAERPLLPNTDLGSIASMICPPGYHAFKPPIQEWLAESVAQLDI